MKKHGQVKEHEIDEFFEKNYIGQHLYYRETLMMLYGQPRRLAQAMTRRTPQENQQLNIIKKKLHEYVVRKGYSISELTAVMDRNNDHEITVPEFLEATKTFLEPSEAVELFNAIDHDKSQTITADEMNVELVCVSASILFEKLKKRAGELNYTAEQLFNMYDNNKSQKMEIEEFA